MSTVGPMHCLLGNDRTTATRSASVTSAKTRSTQSTGTGENGGWSASAVEVRTLATLSSKKRRRTDASTSTVDVLPASCFDIRCRTTATTMTITWSVLVWLTSMTDRQTDGQTELRWQNIVSLAMHDKNWTEMSIYVKSSEKNKPANTRAQRILTFNNFIVILYLLTACL